MQTTSLNLNTNQNFYKPPNSTMCYSEKQRKKMKEGRRGSFDGIAF